MCFCWFIFLLGKALSIFCLNPAGMRAYVVLSCFSCVQLFATLWTVACQALLSMASPGNNTGVGCHALLQGIFPTQRSNPCLLCLLHWQVGSLPLEALKSTLSEVNVATPTFLDQYWHDISFSIFSLSVFIHLYI